MAQGGRGLQSRMYVALAATGILGLATFGAVPAHASTNPVYDKEWALSQFQVTTIRTQYQTRGSGVIVAVVDSGVDATQPDLQGALLPGVNLSNPSSPTSDINDRSNEYHGTSVAAVIAARAHGDSANPQGMYGLATQAKILPIARGADTTTAAADAAAIRYAAEHGARVINISGGLVGQCASDEAAAIDYALSKNVVIVAATGNDGNASNAPSCPADHAGVIDVAAIDRNGHMDPYSHFGSDVTVAAPGVDIEVPYPNGQYGLRSGSSQAAPWVSGEAALIIGKHPDWTAGQVVRVIIENTVQGTGKRIDDHVGYGVIDPLKALGAAAPSDTSNPLGGPAVASAAASPGNGGSTAGGGAGTASAPAASSDKASSKVGLYAGLGVGVLALIGLIVFLITRGKNSNGSGPGGGGGGGGGGGNGYHPSAPGPGGQYAQAPQSQQYPAAPTQHYQGGSGVYQAPQPPPYSSAPRQQQQPYGASPPSSQAAPPPYGYGQHGQPPQEETPWPQQ